MLYKSTIIIKYFRIFVNSKNYTTHLLKTVKIMQNYTLTIPENDSKAIALLNYLKTLDFLNITKDKDWYEELSQEQLKSINYGLDDLEKTRTHTDHEVRKAIHERILNAKK